MFTDDEAVTAGGRDAEALTHQETEPGRIQHAPAANHTVLGETTDLPRHIGQDINCKAIQVIQSIISDRYGHDYHRICIEMSSSVNLHYYLTYI